MKGNPMITLSLMFLTKTKDVLKQTLSLQIWALLISYLICILLSLAEFNVSFDFSKYLVGIRPSWMQFRSALVSTRTMTSTWKSSIINWTVVCHLTGAILFRRLWYQSHVLHLLLVVVLSSAKFVLLFLLISFCVLHLNLDTVYLLLLSYLFQNYVSSPKQ